MHIPDGYLGPQTYVPAYAAMVSLWAVASRKLKKTLRSRQVPLLAFGAAFSFVIMMFNIPIPGGSTGHAVGAVLIAVLLGPWAAMIAVSLALIVQALIFGDGGITAIGANCLNMAFVMPFVGWGVYRLISGSAPATSPRHSIGAALGGYVGLNAAALTTAVMFGIQPLIAHTADGKALYNPFGLHVAVPAMALEHLLLFGWVEAIVTGLVIAYVQRTDPGLISTKSANETPMMRRRGSFVRNTTIALAVLVLAAPLGLYLPARFMAESAWGEWSAEEVQHLVGYLPSGMQKLGSAWHAPMPDYALPGQESAPLRSLSFAYVLSGAIGIAALISSILVFRRYFGKKETNDTDS
ncbi:MAG: cobalt transporter CbiM [Gammaproteobacteria bacterium]|nr:cobalt transporter CbiM [Gammaproteobacteria bacterium]